MAQNFVSAGEGDVVGPRAPPDEVVAEGGGGAGTEGDVEK